MKFSPKLLLLSAAVALSTTSLPAAIIVQDSFSGTTVNNGGTGWFGFSNWNGTIAFTNNLTYSNLVTSGQASVVTDRFGGAGREYPAINSGTIWFSWLQDNSAAPGRNARVNFANQGSQRFRIGQDISELNNNFRIYNSTGTSVADTGISNIGTHMVAGSINLATGLLNLYIDPTGLGLGLAPSSAISATATFGGLDIGEFTLNGGDSTFRFDELRLGDTWQDVSPIPEPSSVALLGLGLVTLAALRRRLF